MKNFAGVLSIIFLLFVIGLITMKTTRAASQTAARTPVVVELFTSEGCSSCPPADALLMHLQNQQPIAGAEIIAFEEHVDYWNHIGWVDPYSSPECTGRQQAYVAMKGDDAYTPELVVDGRSQFVGNDSRQAEHEIEKAARRTKTRVFLEATEDGSKKDGSKNSFTVSVAKLLGNTSGDVAEVWLAVTEDGLHSSVTRGENAGRVLQHVATLRTLQKIGTANANSDPAFKGDAMVEFSSLWNSKNLHVTVFIQEKKSRQILGAATTRPSA